MLRRKNKNLKIKIDFFFKFNFVHKKISHINNSNGNCIKNILIFK